MFEWLRKKAADKARTTGGYPEKQAAIAAKEEVAERILAKMGLDRRTHEEPIPFNDRRHLPA